MRLRSRSRQKKSIPALMVTPLLDMFTIILIFLIVSFEAENYDFRTNPDLQLPESKARTKLRPGVNVQLARTGVFVGDKLVFPLENGRFSDQQRTEASAPALVEVLEEERRARFGESADATEVSESESDSEFDGDEPIIVLQADKGISYQDLYVVLRSAAAAGFFKYRLAAVKE